MTTHTNPNTKVRVATNSSTTNELEDYFDFDFGAYDDDLGGNYIDKFGNQYEHSQSIEFGEPTTNERAMANNKFLMIQIIFV